jgi:formylmethanofuran dehydrogenase subunit E
MYNTSNIDIHKNFRKTGSNFGISLSTTRNELLNMAVPEFDIKPFLEKKRKRGPPRFPSLEEALKIVPKIHGHVCTASYLGTRMALLAVRHLDLERKRDLCAAVEVLTCAADGIASATTCSFGSGRLVFLDHGKFSAIFCNWRTGKAVRISLKPEIDKEHIDFGAKLNDFYLKLGERTLEEAKAEREKLDAEERKLIEKWHKMSDEELFIITEVKVDPRDLQYPLEQQYIPSPVKCSMCGEYVESTRTILKDDRRLCKQCAGIFKIRKL